MTVIVQKPAAFDRRSNVPYRCGILPVRMPHVRHAAGSAHKIKAGQ